MHSRCVVRGIDSLPLRDAVQPAAPVRRRQAHGCWHSQRLLFAIVGWFALLGVAAGPLGSSARRRAGAATHGIAASQQSHGPRSRLHAPVGTPTWSRPLAIRRWRLRRSRQLVADGRRIRIFTARPDSIAAVGPRRTVLRGRRRLTGPHRPWHRRGQPDEHADVSSRCRHSARRLTSSSHPVATAIRSDSNW